MSTATHTNQPSVLVLGATGYIGGAILTAVVKALPQAKVSALTRNSTHDSTLTAAGVARVYHTETTDSEAVKELVAQFDVVVNAIDADDVKLLEAIIAGQTIYNTKRGKKAILLHISGGFVVADDSEGVWDPAYVPVDDADEAAIRDIPSTRFHRNTELLVFGADAAGTLSGYILCPAAVFGKGSGPVRRDSTLLVGLYIGTFGQGIQIGEGTNLWATVHVLDLADLALLILQHALSPASEADGTYAKYYFGATGEAEQKPLARAVVKALQALGKRETDDIRIVNRTEAQAIHPWAGGMANNVVVKANRGKALGWKPKHTESILEAIPEMVAAVAN